MSTTLFSKRKRANSSSVLASKRPNAQVSAQAQDILQDAGDVFLHPSHPASVTQPAAGSSAHLSLTRINSSRQSSARTLKSAFRPPPQAFQWSRDVPLVDYQFTRSAASYQPDGEVKIVKISENLEVISIAKDWLSGETEWEKNQPHYNTGFIGRGFTKRGIYVCFSFPMLPVHWFAVELITLKGPL